MSRLYARKLNPKWVLTREPPSRQNSFSNLSDTTAFRMGAAEKDIIDGAFDFRRGKGPTSSQRMMVSTNG